jgi:uncharacterized membrane protein (DUF2068 family)
MQDSPDETPQPETPRYETLQQGTPQPATPEPETPQPSAPQPEIPRYETLQPSTPQPAPTQPSAPQPEIPRYETLQPAPPPVERQKRPLGVTILSILIGLEGLGEIFLGILAVGALIAISNAVRGGGHANLAAALSVLGWILGILPLVIGAITLFIAIGLFLLKRWAYWTTVIVSIIFLIRQVYELIQPREAYTLVIIGTIIPLVILLYLLLDPSVRQAFRVGGRSNLERLAGT